MIISDDIAFNLIKDFEKRDISREDKSLFISNYLESEKISLRALSNRTRIPLGTLHEWKTMNKWRKSHKLEEDNYVENSNHYKFKSKKGQNEISYLADRLTYLLSKPFKNDPKTLERIRALKSELDKLELGGLN
jgi:hypothetical protein